MKCKNCNTLIPDEGLSCPGCGKSVLELKSLGLIESSTETIEEFAIDNGQDNSTEKVTTETFQMEEISDEKVESVETFSQPQIQESLVKEEVFSPNVGDSSVETFSDSSIMPRNRKSIVPLIGVLAAIVLILGAGFLIYLKFKPKLAFQSVINQSLKQFEKGVGLEYDTIKTDFDLKIKMDGKGEDLEIFNLINKLGISGTFEADYKNNKSFIKLDTSYDKEELLNMDVFYNENEMYVLLGSLYDKYLKYDFDGMDLERPLTEDYKVITESVVKELKKSLKLEYFKKTNAGEYDKNTLQLTNKQADDMARKMLTNLKNDDEFITSLANVTKKNKEELIKSCDEMIDEEESFNEDEDEVAFTIDLYTEKFSNEVKKIEVEMDGEKFVVEFESENSILFKVITSEETFTYKVSTAKDGDRDKIILSMSYDEYSLSVELSYSVKYNEKITEPDVQNSVDGNTLSDSDNERIVENFMKSKGVTKFMEDSGLGNLFMGMGTDYSFDDSLYGTDYGTFDDNPFGTLDDIYS